MKSNREIDDYLKDIVDHAALAIDFLKDVPDPAGLPDDQKTLLATVRALEVIGEAARNVPKRVRDQYSNIPWRGMTGMRDKVIHQYFGVDAAVVWRTVKEDLPPLLEAVREVLAKISDG